MFEEIKELVFNANLKLVEYGLVLLTWGNVSQITDNREYVVIKPSGVNYSKMTPKDMVVVDMNGNIIEGNLRPSSDLATHLELYKRFDCIGGIAHTHSRYAVALAQAERGLPCFNTTHADNFYGDIVCTRMLSLDEIADNYEQNTGKVIVETINNFHIDPASTPGIIVCKHGPFTWGNDSMKAVENALVLDEIAHMAFIASVFNPKLVPAPDYLIEKHYQRKHGINAYYGQK